MKCQSDHLVMYSDDVRHALSGREEQGEQHDPQILEACAGIIERSRFKAG